MTREHYRCTHRLLAACTCALIALAPTQTLLAPNGIAADRGVPNEPLVPEATLPTTIVELQPFRQTSSNRIASSSGVTGTATLVNLNPTINAWYLLKVLWQDGSQYSYHLENPQPRSQSVVLDPQYPVGVQLLEGSVRHPCKLFGSETDSPLAEASKSHLPYASLCEGKLYLRNAVKGHLTRLEAEAEFVRTQVWGGEKVTVIFHHLLEDSHRQTAQLHSAADQGDTTVGTEAPENAPLPALIDAKYAGRVLTPSGLGLTLEHV